MSHKPAFSVHHRFGNDSVSAAWPLGNLCVVAKLLKLICWVLVHVLLGGSGRPPAEGQGPCLLCAFQLFGGCYQTPELRPLCNPPGWTGRPPVQCQGLGHSGSTCWLLLGVGLGEGWRESFPEGNGGWQGPNNSSFQPREGWTTGLDIQFSLLGAIQ